MRRSRLPGGFGFPLGAVLGVAAVWLAVAAGATSQPVLSVVALVVVIDVIALISTAPATLATTVVCWSLHSGFVLGRHGDLALTGQAGHDALVLGLNALLVLLLVSVARAATAPLHEHEHDPTAPRIPTQRQRQPVLTRFER